MYGYLAEGHGEMNVSTIHGVPFLTAALPVTGAFCRLRRRRLWRQLRRAGVRYCVMPRQWDREAAQWGLIPVEVAPLRLALLDEYLDLCPDVRRGTAALCARYADAAVQHAAAVLARRARYVTLTLDQGGEVLAQELQRRCGLCVGSVERAAVTLDFTGCVSGAVILGETGEGIYEVGGQLMQERLVAALFTAQALKKEEICVKSLPINA